MLVKQPLARYAAVSLTFFARKLHTANSTSVHLPLYHPRNLPKILCLVLQPSAPAKKAQPVDKAEQPPQQATGPRQPWWTGVMDRRFVKSFEPLATWTKSLVSTGGIAFIETVKHSWPSMRFTCFQLQPYMLNIP